MPVITRKYKRFKQWLMPIITVGVRFNDMWFSIEAFVDSGATFSIFKANIAENIGLDFRSDKKIMAEVGDGGFIPVYLHDLEIQLNREKLIIPIGFFEKLGIGFNLLGRSGLFDSFQICFNEKRKVVTFEKL